jgi:hypothetical protein
MQILATVGETLGKWVFGEKWDADRSNAIIGEGCG